MGFAIQTTQHANMDGRELLHRFRYHLGSGFISSTDTALDLGCGTGYGTEILADKAVEVRGFDMEQSNIDACGVNHKTFNAIFKCANLEKMKIPAADVACSFEVIEHLYEPKAFIDKIKPKIRKFIAVSVPIGEHMLEDKQEVDGDSTHHSIFNSPQELDNMFIDDNWAKYYGFQTGVTYIAVYYNRGGME